MPVPAPDIETCVNCRRTIGRLESAYLHNGLVVCAECYERLDAAPSLAPLKPTVIEQTSKRLKGQLIAAALLVVVSIIVAASNPDSPSWVYSLCALGFIWFIATRARIWWHHG